MTSAELVLDRRDASVTPTIPSLADRATRERLSPAAIEGLLRLAEFWHIGAAEMCALLGAISERTWFRMRKAEWPGPLSQDEMTRASALVGIFKGLRLLFSLPLADDWVRLPNSNPMFGGRRPLDVMIDGGIPAMLDVRSLVDALRGGV